MGLVWERCVGGRRYQVRRHGASVRLYTDGVFHSQWNSRDPLRGSLWELLLLPAFFRDSSEIRRVLVLGVGGGAVIRLLQRYVGPEQITGVDLDPVHLEVARSHFGAGGAGLVCEDAAAFVSRALQNGAGDYDLIVDDLFGEVGGEAQRTVSASPDWCRQLLRLLSPRGLVVANFGSRREMLASGWRSAEVSGQLWGGWSAELPGYENCILATSRSPLSQRQLHTHAPSQINPSSNACRLACRLRRLR
ncbi:spermidine synthase [Microbulbifer yueqingensis]|uniref:Methyltransferase domain-containing protein n=1 Tax=Microbulbifer yueqingensis TaxID=658219 RepID=A0A1G9ABA5_9GAMM|nr:methyltransferase domain-containing protein [Microbulbifer yueqingensis]SDK24607.1 Methyltransferase domain-containing protein [Microbulbifer yueqingensis]